MPDTAQNVDTAQNIETEAGWLLELLDFLTDNSDVLSEQQWKEAFKSYIFSKNKLAEYVI